MVIITGKTEAVLLYSIRQGLIIIFNSLGFFCFLNALFIEEKAGLNIITAIILFFGAGAISSLIPAPSLKASEVKEGVKTFIKKSRLPNKLKMVPLECSNCGAALHVAESEDPFRLELTCRYCEKHITGKEGGR